MDERPIEMRSYGIELYAAEVTRDRLQDAAQERRLRDARRQAGEAGALETSVGHERPRFWRGLAFRRLAGLKWSR